MSEQYKGAFVERVRRDFIDPLLGRRFVRFLLVGGINAAFAYAVYAMFLFVGLNYALANLLSLIVSYCSASRPRADGFSTTPPVNSFFVFPFAGG